MVYKSVDHGKLWSICFLQYHLFFYEKTKQSALRDMLRHFHGVHSHRPYLSTNQRASIGSVIVKYKVLLFINTTCQSVAMVAVTIYVTCHQYHCVVALCKKIYICI